ncbi:MAG: hypothetical protein ABI967_14765 [bacterium]
MQKHRIVVSAENTPYMEWQCKLFYFSCVTRLKRRPLIIVHSSGQDWCPGFYDIVRAGGAVYSAPNYRIAESGEDYAARNHPGTLIEASRLLGDQHVFIVLCDPDLIFTRAVEFPESPAGEYSAFMDYDSDFVTDPLRRLGISKETLDRQKDFLSCSVPYVVPAGRATELGTTWLHAIDAFLPRRWEDVMYAFGLAVVKLGLKLTITQMADTNYWPDQPVSAPVIHYAYGDDCWTKRNYYSEEEAGAVWDADQDAVPGSILNEILNQIREAGDFYRDPYALAVPRSI